MALEGSSKALAVPSAAAAAADDDAKQASRSAFHRLILAIRAIAAGASEGNTSRSAHYKRFSMRSFRSRAGNNLYLGEERCQGVAVAHAGMLPKPHSSFRVPLVGIANPSLKFHSEDDSRAEPASCIDPLLAALRVAAQKLFNGSLQGLHRLFACNSGVVV